MTIETIVIVPASPENAEEIGEVFYKTWLDTYPNSDHHITIEDIEDRFKNRASEDSVTKRKESILKPKNGETLLVAKKDGKVVGVCRIFIHTDNNELQAIYVLPEYQRLGLGVKFWEEAKKIFDPTKEVIVNTASYNTKAIKFYKKIGFIETGKSFSNERFKMKSGSIIPEIELVLRTEK